MTDTALDRERRLSRTFVTLADTLVNRFDIVDMTNTLVRTCSELLSASAAGIMLADHRAQLHVMASSSEQSLILELLELQNDEGPCLDCFRTGLPIDATPLSAHEQRWPRFTRRPRTRLHRHLRLATSVARRNDRRAQPAQHGR